MDDHGAGSAIFFLLLIAAVYFFPAMIAANRKHASAGAIFVLNLLLGWTFLGWVAALVWSLTGNVRAEKAVPEARQRPAGSAPEKTGRRLTGAFDIEYRDGDGDLTERYIEASSLVDRGGKLYLYGWCEMRQAMRSFRVDRIEALTDGETGEIVEPAEISRWLMARTGLYP